MTLHNLLIDKRIVQRNIEQGKLEAGEYQRFLDALPDLSDRVWRKPVATEEPRPSIAQAGAQAAAQTEPVQAAPAVVAPANAEAVASAARNDVVPAFDASL